MLSQTKDIIKNTWGLAFPCDLSLLRGSLFWFLLSKKNHVVMTFTSDWYVVTRDSMRPFMNSEDIRRKTIKEEVSSKISTVTY